MSRDKAEVRTAGRRARAGFTGSQREQAADDVGRHLTDLVQTRAARAIGLYAATGSELDLAPFARDCQDAGLTLAWPRVSGPGELVFHVVDGPAGLVAGWRGIMEPPLDAPIVEPSELDLLLVPGVCFDREGGRLGQGGGYYDRLLATAPELLVVGVAFEVQVVQAVPAGPLDVPVGGLVTERGYVHLSRRGAEST